VFAHNTFCMEGKDKNNNTDNIIRLLLANWDSKNGKFRIFEVISVANMFTTYWSQKNKAQTFKRWVDLKKCDKNTRYGLY